MKRYTFIFGDGTIESATAHSQWDAFQALGNDHSMIGWVKKVRVDVCES